MNGICNSDVWKRRRLRGSFAYNKSLYDMSISLGSIYLSLCSSSVHHLVLSSFFFFLSFFLSFFRTLTPINRTYPRVRKISQNESSRPSHWDSVASRGDNHGENMHQCHRARYNICPPSSIRHRGSNDQSHYS